MQGLNPVKRWLRHSYAMVSLNRMLFLSLIPQPDESIRIICHGVYGCSAKREKSTFKCTEHVVHCFSLLFHSFTGHDTSTPMLVFVRILCRFECESDFSYPY